MWAWKGWQGVSSCSAGCFALLQPLLDTSSADPDSEEGKDFFIVFLCKISVVEPGGCDSRCSVVPTEQGADPSQGWMPKGTLVKLSPFTAAEDLGMSGRKVGGKCT